MVIAGVGPGLGMGIARCFGKQRFRVALIARRESALAEYSADLKAAGIEAAGFAADLRNQGQVAEVFARIRATFGSVDILEYSPLDWADFPSVPVEEVTPETVQTQLAIRVLGAVSCVRQVLPGMIQKKSGALLLTGGSTGVSTIPGLAHIGVSQAGLRSYALALHKELGPKGIYAAWFGVRAKIEQGTAGDPDLLASSYRALYRERNRPEVLIP